MPRIKVDGFQCARCGHKWAPRVLGAKPPVVCPKCKSPYWDKPRSTKKR